MTETKVVRRICLLVGVEVVLEYQVPSPKCEHITLASQIDAAERHLDYVAAWFKKQAEAQFELKERSWTPKP